MKKQDLIIGKHILFTNQGEAFLYLGDIAIGYNDAIDMNSLDDELVGKNSKWYVEQIYLRDRNFVIDDLMNVCELHFIWERLEFTKDEKAFLKIVDKHTNYGYIARDENGNLHLYSEEPRKLYDEWCYKTSLSTITPPLNISVVKNLFTMVKWEDNQALNISKLRN